MKTLLAYLSSKDNADDVLAAAIPLARRVTGHLIGLHIYEPLAPYPGLSFGAPDMLYADFTEQQSQAAKALKEVFEARVHAEDFVSEWRELRAQSMAGSDLLVEAAQTCDISIVAQADAIGDHSHGRYVQEQLIRRSGRPVLYVPKGYQGDEIGKSVVIGWSPTREAARAAHDAIPLMAGGGKAWIVAVKDGAGDQGAMELAQALDRHGIEAEVVLRAARQQDIANVLEREAMERGADLIVTGAFGHSRLYDFVIGAVTLDLMQTSTYPVLFSR